MRSLIADILKKQWLLLFIAKTLPCIDYFNHTMRPYLLKWAGVEVSAGCVVHPGIEITSGPLQIGNNSFINNDVRFECTGCVHIGSFCQIGPRVSFETVTHPLELVANQHRPVLSKPISVEDYVWIGSSAIILAGVTIGRGSVVGAGAVVTKDVPAYSLVVGNPARVLRQINNSGNKPS